jgi:hypothetical protein
MPRKTKLTTEQQEALRAYYRGSERPSIPMVAQRFGVSYTTAFNVIHFKGAFARLHEAAQMQILFPDGEV